ncbi:MAG TPA: DUF4407 domain-containing protein [Pyrinomonadaceae bacterium]|nr:DUF4407 domain-containing protein [Pyrinomonadaceae bacterium]
MSILNREECAIEHNKYMGIGATILSTAVMAMISGGYAIFTAFQIAALSIFFGVLWGLIIFNLDRYIVSTLRKRAISPSAAFKERVRARAKEVATALPRILLALFISIIITRPIELRLFEREIDSYIESDRSDRLARSEQQIRQEFPELKELSDENQKLLTEIKNKEKQRDELHELAMAEALGAQGARTTGRVGKGLVYRERLEAFEKADAELNRLRETNETRVAANELRIAAIREQKDASTRGARETIYNRNGLLARLEAHSYLAEHNRSIALASWALVILFILLETAPLIVKLLSDRGPYEEILEAMEHKVYVEERKKISDINERANTSLSLSKQQNAGLLAAELRLSKATMASLETLASVELREARIEIARLLVAQWKKAEMKKLSARGGSMNGPGNGFAPHPAAVTEKLPSPEPEVEELAAAASAEVAQPATEPRAPDSNPSG